MRRSRLSIGAFAGLGLLAVTGASLAGAQFGGPIIAPGRNLLIEVAKDKPCCFACAKHGKHKSCRSFCGPDAKTKCEDYKQSGKDGTGSPSKKGPEQPKLEDMPCYPICEDQCLKTRGSLTFEQCVIDCLNRTRCSG